MENSCFEGLSKLKDFSCEVQRLKEDDEKQCILNFKIGNNLETEEISMSISKPGLDVLLDGLHKVQNQLSSVASKNKT